MTPSKIMLLNTLECGEYLVVPCVLVAPVIFHMSTCDNREQATVTKRVILLLIKYLGRLLNGKNHPRSAEGCGGLDELAMM